MDKLNFEWIIFFFIKTLFFLTLYSIQSKKLVQHDRLHPTPMKVIHILHILSRTQNPLQRCNSIQAVRYCWQPISVAMISIYSASIHTHSGRYWHPYIICMCYIVAIQRPEYKTWYSRRIHVGVLLQQLVVPPIYSPSYHMEVCIINVLRSICIFSLNTFHHIHFISPLNCVQVLQLIEHMAQPWWSIATHAIIDRLA